MAIEISMVHPFAQSLKSFLHIAGVQFASSNMDVNDVGNDRFAFATQSEKRS